MSAEFAVHLTTEFEWGIFEWKHKPRPQQGLMAARQVMRSGENQNGHAECFPVFHFHFVAWQLRMRHADREREKLSARASERESTWVSVWVSVVGSWLFNALDMKMSNETCDKRWSPFWVYCLMIWTFYTYTHIYVHIVLYACVSLSRCLSASVSVCVPKQLYLYLF